MSDEKNPAAVALGKKRWAGTSDADRSQAMSDLAAKRSAKMTPERRSEIAKKAAAASAKVRKKKAKKKK